MLIFETNVIVATASNQVNTVDSFRCLIFRSKCCHKYLFIFLVFSFQDMILSQMKPVIPKNIARNTALRENVFMMLVCIELKIPLFVIGKPGSSKSLAKSIIANSMQGAASPVKLCHKLKQVC